MAFVPFGVSFKPLIFFMNPQSPNQDNLNPQDVDRLLADDQKSKTAADFEQTAQQAEAETQTRKPGESAPKATSTIMAAAEESKQRDFRQVCSSAGFPENDARRRSLFSPGNFNHSFKKPFRNHGQQQ